MRFISILCLLSCLLPLSATEPAERPVTASYMIGAGSSRLADTYLSPLSYSGWHTEVAYSRMQAPRLNPGRLTMTVDVNLGLDRALNPARNATMWGLLLHAEWGLLRRWALPGAVTLAAGGSVAAEGGVLYNSRNGNNPASAKGAATLNFAALAAWHTHIGRIPLTLSYHTSIPLVGAFFAPDYGELYYEIYLGNRSGLVHAAWPGSYFRFDNLLAADIRLGRATSLRLGYGARVFSSKASDIVTRNISHSFIIGVSGSWISLGSPAKRVINAY